ncbi:MAG: hypothetical protein QXJ28_01395 [Candidatus Pacearchaeota archaeon]
MDLEILCKTKWHQVGYFNENREEDEKVTRFHFCRIYSPAEMGREVKYLSSLGIVATLIECEPYKHDGRDCEFCEYKNCRGNVNLFENDKNF